MPLLTSFTALILFVLMNFSTFYIMYTICYIYIYMHVYIYIYIHTNLPVSDIVRLPHPWSGDSQGQETFL